MGPGSDETDLRLARRLAREEQKETQEAENNSQVKADNELALNPTLPPKEQAGSVGRRD